MKKIFVLLAAAIALSGCQKASFSNETERFSEKPDWMADCKFAFVRGEDHGNLYVVRCPNSTTTTTTIEKHPTTVVVIDGVEYVQK